jgi:hypothetical protein
MEPWPWLPSGLTTSPFHVPLNPPLSLIKHARMVMDSLKYHVLKILQRMKKRSSSMQGAI